MCSFVYLFARLLTGSTLGPSRSGSTLRSAALALFGGYAGSHRTRSCARPPWSSATSVLDRSAWSFLRLVVLAPGRFCALALSLPSARPSPAISRAAVQSPLPWRLHPCNKFIHACIDSLILSLIHSFIHSLAHSFNHSFLHLCPFHIS